MVEIPLLGELALVVALAVAVTVVLARLRLPTVAGLLAAGGLLGPFGLKLVEDVHAIELLAEVGVVLLLFTIGLEFSFSRLRHIFRRVALGGLAQVLATLGVTVGVALLLGQPPARAGFFGVVLALSSTAIVLRALGDRGELDAPHGRFIVGTLIFQDLCVVPMVLLVPVLGGGQPGGEVALEIGVALGKAALVVLGTLGVARLLVPRLLRLVDASRSREVFLLAILALCVGTAWLTSLAGLSLALGAFLGGMVVADTEFQHRAMGEMIPLRDAFVSIFFISLGMLFDSRLLLSHPLAVALLLLAFILGKAFLATLAAVIMRFPARAAFLAGIGLGQFGEFGFVLLKLGRPVGLADPDTTGPLLAAGILSMFLTPLLIRLAPHLTAGEKLLAPLTRLLGVRGIEETEPAEHPASHVVVIGYGVAGQLVARTLASCSLPHLVLEMNAETVRQARLREEPVFYADATSPEALSHAGILAARAAVVLINDQRAALRVVDTLRRVAPHVPVIVRTRYLGERERLLDLGASEVVAEEVESSVEVLARLLRRMDVPRNQIDERIRQARELLSTSDRKITVPRKLLPEHEALADLKIESLRIQPGSQALGRSARELDIGRKSRALIVALRRGEQLLDAPDPTEPFLLDDVLYLVGSGEAIVLARELLEGPAPASPTLGSG